MPAKRPRSSVPSILNSVVRGSFPLADEVTSSNPISPSKQPTSVALELRLEKEANLRKYYFPETIANFWDGNTASFSHNIHAEVRSAIDFMVLFSLDLSQFVTRRDSFERQLLTGNLDGARSTLADAKSRLGESLWTMEAELLLAEHHGGVEELKSVVSDLQDRSPSAYTRAIASQLGQRVGRNLSNSTYDANLDYFLSFLQDTDYWRRIANALMFRLNFARADQLRDLAYTIWTDNRWPLVDRYQLLLRVLGTLTAFANDTVERSWLPESVSRLTASIRDPVTLNLALLLQTGPQLGQGTDRSADLLRVLDLYTRGDYVAGHGAATEGLLRFPQFLEYYLLKAKCNVNAGGHLSDDLPTDSAAANVYAEILNVVSKNSKTSESLQRLLRFAQVYHGLPLSINITEFCASQLGDTPPLPNSLVYAMNHAAITPLVIRDVAKMFPSVATLGSTFASQYPESPTVSLFFDVTTSAGSTSGGAIPQDRRLKYTCIREEERGDCESALAGYRRLLETARDKSTFDEDAVCGMFRCFFTLKRMEECVDHVTETYLRKPSLLVPLKLGELAALRKKSNHKDNISWPLLYYIHFSERGFSKTTHELYAAYDDFLRAHEIRRPSQLESMVERFDRQKLLSFLKNVCTREVMRRSTAYKNATEFEAERLALCQWILREDPTSSLHRDEIVEIAARSRVRQGLQQVGEKKVYADTRGIARKYERVLHEKFNRFHQNAMLADEDSKKVTLEIRHGTESHVVVITFNDVAFVAFRELFNELKTYFTENTEFGLDGYLSTRIRHGVLSGQLRRVFESHHLVTRTTDGKYETNQFWRDEFERYGDDFKDASGKVLEKFSKAIDALVAAVNDQWIRISSKPNSGEGFFNYEFSNLEMLAWYHDCSLVETCEDFLSTVFDALWQRTEVILQKVRKKIREDLRDEIMSRLNQLEKDINGIRPGVCDWQFSKAVADCRTAVQNELDMIAEWFSVAGKTESPDFELSAAVETAAELCRKSTSGPPVEVTISINGNLNCRGETFIHFVYIFLMLLDNVTKRSGLTKPSAMIRARLVDGQLVIQPENELGAMVDIREQEEKLEE